MRQLLGRFQYKASAKGKRHKTIVVAYTTILWMLRKKVQEMTKGYA